MSRWILVLSFGAIVVCQATALAECPPNYPSGVFCGCPSGDANEIFCEDFDTYCDTGGWPGGAGAPGGPKCSTDPLEPATASGNDKMRSVWFQTSMTESDTPTMCGTQAILEDSQIQVTTPPFGGEYPGAHFQPMAQHTFRDWTLSPAVTEPIEDQVLNLTRFIKNAHGSQAEAVTVVDDNQPLVLKFSLDSLSDGKIFYTNGFIEMAFGPPTNHLNRANTDYALHPHCYSFCSPYIDQGPCPMICAYRLPETFGGSIYCTKPLNTPPPLRNAIAIGLLPMLDIDPCHCGSSQAHGGQSSHPVFFNGRQWYNLRANNPGPSSGTITPLTPGTPSTVPTTGVDAPLYHPQRVGRFVLWQNPLVGGTESGTPPVDKPYNWLTVTIKTTTVRIELRKVLTAISNPSWKWEVYEWMDNVPLEYRGPFDSLRMGVGAGCELESTTSWECKAGSPRTCIDCLGNQARFADFDDMSLSGGAPYTAVGACCLTDGSCQDGSTQNQCTGTFRGENTTCANNGEICLGACCKGEENGCADTKVNECPQQQGFVFEGFGTRCATTQCPCSEVFADADRDGDVDQFDFAAFQNCVAGPGITVSGTCHCFDRTDDTASGAPDNDVDQWDWTKFEACASGPGVPLNPSCDD